MYTNEKDKAFRAGVIVGLVVGAVIVALVAITFYG